MSDEGKFSFESMQDNTSIQRYLQSLEEGFAKGKIVLSTDGEEMVMRPGGMLRFSVKAKKKNESCKINLKVEWKEMAITSVAPSEDMVISS
ncbi:MAG: amphi-Trp domain-containing protein [Deltaproteobacteria bacterium]|nr:amphi-Trp domain-containing protein [Deltaproteobacteria bacterium]